MPRLTTPDGFVIEFDDPESLMWALDKLRGAEGSPPAVSVTNQTPTPTQTSPGDVIKAVTRTNGQRDLLKALAGAKSMLTSDELAKLVKADKYVVMGNLGAVYANAAEQKIDPTAIVRRERHRMNGRRTYRYGPGPLLVGS